MGGVGACVRACVGGYIGCSCGRERKFWGISSPACQKQMKAKSQEKISHNGKKLSLDHPFLRHILIKKFLAILFFFVRAMAMRKKITQCWIKSELVVNMG